MDLYRFAVIYRPDGTRQAASARTDPVSPPRGSQLDDIATRAQVSVDPKDRTASRCWLERVVLQQAVQRDWIARLPANRRRLAAAGDLGACRVTDAELQARRQDLDQLIEWEQRGRRIVEDQDRRGQALCDWQLDHIEVVEAQWHAQVLMDRQQRAVDQLEVRHRDSLLPSLALHPSHARSALSGGPVRWRFCSIARTTTSPIGIGLSATSSSMSLSGCSAARWSGSSTWLVT